MNLDARDIDLNALSKGKFLYINTVLEGKEDKVSLAEIVLKIYSEAVPDLSPRILISRGPLETKLFLEIALGIESQSIDKFNIPIEFGAFKNAKNLAEIFHGRSMNWALRCSKKFNSLIPDSSRKELRSMIFSDLNFQLPSAIYGRVKQMRNSNFSRDNFLLRPANSPSWDDLDWIGFYDLIRDYAGVSLENDSLTRGFLQNGGMQLYAFDTFAVICPKPSLIERNENLVLHCETGPALSWEDGSRAYFWDGIQVPEKLIENPEHLTSSDILQETNAEVRRCYQEILGSERFGNLLGLMALDHKRDRFGNDLILYRTKDVDRLAGDFIYFAKVVCPSTGRNYFLCVPPSIRSVEEAVAWTFGKSAQEYKPVIET